jgi:GNAT superfamily N-acetyltransferase
MSMNDRTKENGKLERSVIYAPVDACDASFLALTFPAYWRHLERREPDVIALGARVDGLAVGLALGRMVGETVEAGGQTAQLLSLMVARPFRCRGIGTGLVKALEAQLAARGIVGVFAYHSSRLPACAAFEGLLASERWLGPKMTELRLTGQCGLMIEAVANWPTVRNRLEHRENYLFTPWREVGGEADAAAIDRLVRQPPCARAPLIHPEKWRDLYDPAVSIAVRRAGRLVGWVAAHLVAPAAPSSGRGKPQLYYVSYLDEALQKTGILVSAYLNAFRLQEAAHGPESLAHYTAVERAMVAITRRRFAPIATWVDEIRISGKKLVAKQS